MERQGMRCDGCDLVWYSRVAAVIVSDPQLARCAKCGGRLFLEEAVRDGVPVEDELAATA